MGKKVDFAVAILNGAIGDYLDRNGNGLATEMSFVHGGRPMVLKREELERLHPQAGARVAILVHGLMCTETIFELADGADYGTWLARDFGYTPLYVRYNSGLSIRANAESLARLFDELHTSYPAPIEELLLVGYSMGGLIVRGACHVASRERQAWLSSVARAIYVGTPHLGSPLERAGRVLTKVLAAIDDPYTRLAAELGEMRSRGVKDLGDPAHVVPLLPAIRHYLIAGTVSQDPLLSALFGDAIVPVASATDGACVNRESMALPPAHVKIIPGVPHPELPRRPEVYAQIRAWLEEERK